MDPETKTTLLVVAVGITAAALLDNTVLTVMGFLMILKKLDRLEVTLKDHGEKIAEMLLFHPQSVDFWDKDRTKNQEVCHTGPKRSARISNRMP